MNLAKQGYQAYSESQGKSDGANRPYPIVADPVCVGL
jgi:hypothetical protein